jgi:hypothetical protein
MLQEQRGHFVEIHNFRHCSPPYRWTEGFITLLGEKELPRPSGLAVELGWYCTTTQNHFSSDTQREPDSQKSSFKERLAQDTSESTPPAAHLILSSMCG